MNRIPPVLLTTVFVLAGCAASPPVPPAEKEVLRKILVPTFALTSFPKEREEDLYRVLQVFARERKDEIVTNVEFGSGSEASIQFSWSGGFHGGSAKVRKKWGKWTIVERFYFL